MDLIIQMLPASVRKFSTHMDFVGQKKAEQVLQWTIASSAVLGFMIGFAFGRISYMIYTIFIGSLIASVLVIPPWGCFKKNDIIWQPNCECESEQSSEEKSSQTKSREAKPKKESENAKKLKQR